MYSNIEDFEEFINFLWFAVCLSSKVQTEADKEKKYEAFDFQI